MERLIHRLTARAMRHFRPRRLRLCYELCGITAETRVADLGGTPYFWMMAQELGLPVPWVTIVNLFEPGPELHPKLNWVVADATKLPFRNDAFDLVFCNSLIEHLYSSEAQRDLAAEIGRVAARYFVQTPSRRFPVEQHLWGLGVHWAPRGLRPGLMRWTTLAGLTARFDLEKCRNFSRELVLLDRAELQSLFPRAQIVTERFLGLEKSLVAYG